MKRQACNLLYGCPYKPATYSIFVPPSLPLSVCDIMALVTLVLELKERIALQTRSASEEPPAVPPVDSFCRDELGSTALLPPITAPPFCGQALGGNIYI